MAKTRDKWVYLPQEGNKGMKDILGGKGANLCEMWNMGLPIPPFFVASTNGCVYYMENKKMPPGIEKQVKEGLDFIAGEMGRSFGDVSNPLLLSVRSGAKFSMPGMMDTVLNIGMNKAILDGLIKKTGNERFARDCFRRLLQMYGEVVLGANKKKFETAIHEIKVKNRRTYDSELTASELSELIVIYENILKESKVKIPTDPMEQLMLGIEAVFKSWNTERATAYRNVNRIPHNLGTAVNCQAMVFGNVDDESGSGVMFTRNPSSGEKVIYGELLFNAQGEEVVAGIRDPLKLNELKIKAPELYSQLEKWSRKLETVYRDMQDMEFTFESGRLFILQTRNGKRTGPAAVRIASDLVDEKLLKVEEAVQMIDPGLLVQCLVPIIKPGQKYKERILGKGLEASPGAACGQIVFSSERLLQIIAEAKEKREKVPDLLLVRNETNPDDFPGMHAAQGILTSKGGMTSHAAVVARQMGKPCVAGCRGAEVDDEEGFLKFGNKIFREGDYITIDGTEGHVIEGQLDLIRNPKPGKYFERVMDWSDKYKVLGVRANADTGEDAKIARSLGAQGIGLCRTEHQFGGPRKLMIAELILLLMVENPDPAQLKRKQELIKELLKVQKKDFEGVLREMDGYPTTIRLIDPPFHEFLPKDSEIDKLLSEAHTDADRKKITDMAQLRDKIHEANPMLGLRGCRLGILFPVITETQVRAIFEAACTLKKKGLHPIPEIMIPLTAEVNELNYLEPLVRNTAAEVMKQYGVKVDYKYGTMIEIPRAALTSDEIAKVAEFFSFGTNDLTQTGWGLSRDDTASMLKEYVAKGIIPVDPFEVLDQRGIGKLMRICIDDARKVRAKIKLGICGEHGGEPESVAFCHKLRLDYVSCSTYRVPGARLAAAQAALREKTEKKDSKKK